MLAEEAPTVLLGGIVDGRWVQGRLPRRSSTFVVADAALLRKGEVVLNCPYKNLQCFLRKW